jgi:hypothetical protein
MCCREPRCVPPLPPPPRYPLFLTGTIYELCRPGGKPALQRSNYTGYKKVHGLKFQLICFPDGIMGPLWGPFCCRFHDTSILEESGLLELLRAHFKLEGDALIHAGRALYFSLFGDSGYVLSASPACLHGAGRVCSYNGCAAFCMYVRTQGTRIVTYS